MKTWLIAGLMWCVAAPVMAEELACREEYKKLNEASLQMAAPDLTAERIEKVQTSLDEWQPKYAACMDAYGEKNGADARAALEARLSAETSAS